MVQQDRGTHATSPTKTIENAVAVDEIKTIVSLFDQQPPIQITDETNDNVNITENGDNDPEVVLDQKTTKQTIGVSTFGGPAWSADGQLLCYLISPPGPQML